MSLLNYIGISSILLIRFSSSSFRFVNSSPCLLINIFNYSASILSIFFSFCRSFRTFFTLIDCLTINSFNFTSWSSYLISITFMHSFYVEVSSVFSGLAIVFILLLSRSFSSISGDIFRWWKSGSFTSALEKTGFFSFERCFTNISVWNVDYRWNSDLLTHPITLFTELWTTDKG